MRILIVGAGTIGLHLAKSLVSEGQDVVVIDTRQERLDPLENTVDCQVAVGNALSPALLENLGIRRTDLLVAVTESDAVNMAVCRLADFYSVPRKMARLRSPELTDPDSFVPSEHFGIDHIISPERLTVDHIERLIRCPGAIEAMDFEGGRIAVRALVITEDSPIAGETVSHLREMVEGEYLIAAIRRGIRVIIPNGDEAIRLGDTVYVIGSPATAKALAERFNPNQRTARRLIIFGGGVAGIELARRLSGELSRVVLLEPDEARAELAAESVDDHRVQVLLGSALDEELMARAGMENADFYVALSDDDEENFMSALMFRRYSNGTPIVVTSKPDYIEILESVDLDVALNPRNLAVGTLLRHLRGQTVLSVAKLRREDAEIVELQVEQGAALTRGPLADLALPAGLLVAAVLRAGQFSIPGGTTEIRPGDRILAFSELGSVKHLVRLAKARR